MEKYLLKIFITLVTDWQNSVLWGKGLFPIFLLVPLLKKTKFPSVILLMITGIIARVIANKYGFENTVLLNSLIPVIGTIGLILIVMEGALELDIRKKKLGLILSGFLAALVILILNIIILNIIIFKYNNP